MGGIDLDAARQAREEVAAERFFVFHDQRFDLPADLPYDVLEGIGRLAVNEADLGAITAVMVALLGEEDHERFRSLRPSLADLNDLVAAMFVEYNLGQSAAAAAADGDDGGGNLDPKSPPSPRG